VAVPEPGPQPSRARCRPSVIVGPRPQTTLPGDLDEVTGQQAPSGGSSRAC